MKPKGASCAKLETKERFSNAALGVVRNIYVQLQAQLPSYRTIGFHTQRTKQSVGSYRTWLYLSRCRQTQRGFRTVAGSKPPAQICPPRDIPAQLLISQT